MSDIDPKFLALLFADDVLVQVVDDQVVLSHGDREERLPADEIKPLVDKFAAATKRLEEAADDYEERATERQLRRAFGDACKRAVEFTPASLGLVEHPAGSGKWRLAASDDAAYATFRYEMPTAAAEESEFPGSGVLAAAYRSLLPAGADIVDSDDNFDPEDPQIVAGTVFTAAGVEVAGMAGLETPSRRVYNVWAPSFFRYLPSKKRRGRGYNWYPGKEIEAKLRNRPKVDDSSRGAYLLWLIENADVAADYAATVAEAEKLFEQTQAALEENTRAWQRKSRAKRHLPPSAIKKIRSECSHASYAERGWVTGGTFAVCVPLVSEERPRDVEATPEELVYVGRFEHQDALRRRSSQGKRDKWGRFYSTDLDLFRELFPEPDFVVRVPEGEKVVFVCRNIPEYVAELEGAVALWVLAGEGADDEDDG